MSVWNVCCIDELGSVNRGKSKHRPRNDAILFGGLYPFIQTADVKNANLYISEYDATYSEIGLAQSKLWKKGTLCITIAANIAESAILGIDACFPDSVVGFIPYAGKSDLKFVKYMLDEFKVYMQQISKGTTQDNLSLEKLRRIKFYVPSYEIQQKIAHILSRYDEAIENNNKRIKLLEQMAQNLYKEWFVRFRFPGWKNAEFENGIPVGWKVEKVKNLVKRLPFGKTYKKDGLSESGRVVVIDQSEDEVLGYHDNEPSHKASFDEPIALFGDHSCKYVLMTENFSLGENIIPFLGNNIDLYYLYFSIYKIIQTEEYKRHWSLFINKKILVPFEELQLRFRNHVISILSTIQKLKKQNINLAQQRDLLLPRLMSGKMTIGNG